MSGLSQKDSFKKYSLLFCFVLIRRPFKSTEVQTKWESYFGCLGTRWQIPCRGWEVWNTVKETFSTLNILIFLFCITRPFVSLSFYTACELTLFASVLKHAQSS